MSELDSCDIQEAAVTPRPASELSGLGRQKTLLGPLAARRCSNYEAVYLGKPDLLSLENGKPEKRPSELLSLLRKSLSELDFRENTAQCAHVTDGETKVWKGIGTQPGACSESGAEEREIERHGWRALVKSQLTSGSHLTNQLGRGQGSGRWKGMVFSPLPLALIN